jgi:hypothetical protein
MYRPPCSAPMSPLDDAAAASIMASAPFIATQAFIRKGLGLNSSGGAVDRTMTLAPPMRFTYDNQFPGTRPPVAMPSFGPIIPDTISPGLENYLSSLLTLQTPGPCPLWGTAVGAAAPVGGYAPAQGPGAPMPPPSGPYGSYNPTVPFFPRQ